MEVKIALVSPKRGFFKNAGQIFAEHNKLIPEPDDGIQCSYCLEEMEIKSSDVSDAEKFNLQRYDAVIARGITADLLRRRLPGLTVIDIPVSGTDLIYCLKTARDLYLGQNIGIVGSRNMILGADHIGEILGMEVKMYFRDAPGDVVSVLGRAIKDGCEVIIGGVESCQFAKKHGLECLLIHTGKPALWYAFGETKRVFRMKLYQQRRILLIQTVLDNSSEGIVLVGPDKKIMLYNNKAQNILSITSDMTEENLEKLFGIHPLPAFLCDSESYYNEIIVCKDKKLSVNKFPVHLKDSPVCYVVSFQNVSQLQNAEKVIRKKVKNLGWTAKYTFDDIIGSSPAIRELIRKARRYAETDSDILLIGQSGTGKELLAQSIHNASDRKKGPFVAINCAALSQNLLESELFGYVDGAFTGAQKGGKEGLFEQAHTGTIFLDEIGEVPLELQAKLLRVIQEREVMRIGDNKMILVDIRIVAATNRDLNQYVRESKFRLDLYYRLDVLHLKLPTLNERGHDIGILAEYLLNRKKEMYCKRLGDIRLTKEAGELLERIEWKGNIRQLNNICMRLIVNSDTDEIGAKEIYSVLNQEEWTDAAPAGEQAPGEVNLEDRGEVNNAGAKMAAAAHLREPEETARIREALDYYSYNRQKTAKALGMSRSTLWRKMKKYHFI